MITKRAILLALVAGAFGINGVTQATAQVFPSRPITMVVPAPAGGPTDALGRIMAERMRTSLGQPIIIENVSGAANSLALRRVARAAPDGYTFSIGQLNSHVFSGVLYDDQYVLLKDFEPIAKLTTAPLLLISKNAMAARDLRELIAWLQANPDKASFGTIGNGSPPHVWGVYFQNNTGTRFQFVPYRGAPPVVQDLVAGQIDLTCLEASNVLPHVRAGRIKAYAVLSKSRWQAALDIPTLEEAGAPGLYMPFWFGLWGPKGTPKDVIAKLNAAVVDALADAATRQRLIDLGHEIPPREEQTPEALGAFHNAEIEKWRPIIKEAGIKAE